ncbi:NUMOD1 domain-containing DNA-binding protein [Flavobacterium sp.]|uniref:NUMOD1 domain-containing DNA-binding protein n=1 Tax=Flavobacterium sp. TaxID=239 RepID=UPI0025BC5F12|nr:NUMOD1 domain-containing DNA-binding protein [Flavobacterium sp.]MBA4155817.1 endonuclease [Flavobacterium sp.]
MANIIYKVTNILNNECYVGATTKTLEERKIDHLQKSEKNVGSYFQEAIGTYGPEAFLWEQIDTASTIDELAQKEIQYINQYNSFEEGYNSDKGGGFKKTIYKYNLNGSLNSTYESLTDAGKSVNVRKQDISRACWSINHTLGGYLWSYEYIEPFIPKMDNRKKEVLQYSLNGNLLAKYVSASEASRKTGVSKTCITRCCRGEREHSRGFIWEYS